MDLFKTLKGSNVHVVWAKVTPFSTVEPTERWILREEGKVKANVTAYITKESAVLAGIVLAKTNRSELFVHRKDGTIEYRNSYGNDPYPPKG